MGHACTRSAAAEGGGASVARLLRLRAVALAGLVFLCVLAGRVRAGEEVRLTAVYGFQGPQQRATAKLGHWAPVTVEIVFAPEDPSRTLAADLRLHAWSESERPDALRRFWYARPVAMGAGRKAVTVYGVPIDQPLGTAEQPLEVSLFDRTHGRELARIPVPRSSPAESRLVAEEAALVVTLGADRADLNGLVRELERAWKRSPWYRNAKGWFDTPLEIVAADLAPAHAPDAWIGYQGVDVLVWDTPRPDRLRPAQLAAIREWVGQGGRLVVWLPAEGPLPDLAALADLLPAEVDGRTTLPLAEPDAWEPGAGDRLLPPPLQEACAGVWEYAYRADGRHPAQVRVGERPAEMVLTRLVSAQGRVLLPLRTGGPPLLVRRAYGLGTVSLLALDPAAWPLADFPGRHALLGRALGLALDARDIAVFENPYVARQAEGEGLDEYRAWQRLRGRRGTDTLLRHVAGRYLASAPPLQPVPFWWVVAFFSVYVLLVGPLDYLLLRRSHRLRLTWVTFLAYVAGFAGIAYGGAYAIKGGKTFARFVTVRDQAASQDAVRERCFFGLFSARAQAFDLWFGPGAWPVALGEHTFAARSEERRLRGAYPPDGRARAIVQGEKGRMEGVPLRKWSMKSFLHDALTAGPTLAEGDLHYAGRTLEGGFTIAPDVRLLGAVLIGRHGVYELGMLQGGAQWSAREAGERRPLLPYLAELKEDWDAWRYRREAEDAAAPDATETEARSRVRRFVALSLPRLLGSWDGGLRARMLRAQHEPPRLRLGDKDEPLTARALAAFFHGGPLRSAPTEAPQDEGEAGEPGKKGRPVPPPRLGLSIEQVWNARVRPEERALYDLSQLVWQGGLVLVAAVEPAACGVRAAGWRLEREGILVVRVIFPFHPNAQGGRLWHDDLYRSAY